MVIVFLAESRFNLWDYGGRVHIRRYAGQRCLSMCVLERYSDRTPGVMVWCVILYPICYELRIILIVTGTSLNCYSLKSFLSFKESKEVSFSRITHTYMLQRLFQTSVRSDAFNLFLGLLICRIRCLLSKCGIWIVRASPVISVLQFQNFGADASNMEFSSTNRHSKSV